MPLVYPKNIAEKLEFTQIIAQVQALCTSETGKMLAEQMSFSADYATIHQQLLQTNELKSILQIDNNLPDDSIPNIQMILAELAVEGSFLDAEQLYKLWSVMILLQKMMRYFEKNGENLPELSKLFDEIYIEKRLVAAIERVIDADGRIRANASKDLQNISVDIIKYETEARKKITTIFKHAQAQGWAGDTEISVREGRLVIPILAEYKRKIKGFIHDESATGQTVFIEPAEVLDLNNEVRDLQLAYKRELRRILIALAYELRPSLAAFVGYQAVLAQIDFVRAKARYALATHSHLPALAPHARRIRLIDAHHPLLLLHHKKLGKKIIPLNLTLTPEKHILVVSGPNAGGKSICLKTVGIIQYMLQCGMLIPASADSEMGIFNNVFTDIGDQQSIENDLSTYSSHLTNMRYFVEYTDKHTLFLIDEFGTGTDPHLGGPIAEAILDAIKNHHAFGIVNTHYSNLKLYASHTTGVVNGSMGFDTRTLAPLYTLSVGNPGSSFAFEIAQKIGLPSHILEAAKAKVGAKQQNVESLLVELAREKAELENLQKLMHQKDELLSEILQKTQAKEADLSANKQKYLQQAREEAKKILTNANRDVENAIRTIKETQANPELTKQVRQKINDTKKEIETELQADATPTSPPKNTDQPTLKVLNKLPEVGDFVQLKNGDSIGVILEINKKQAQIAVGDLKISVKVADITVVQKQIIETKSTQNIGSNIAETSLNFTTKLDVRGQRTSDALEQLETFIDKALMLNQREISVLHGKGDGILRKFIRDYLKNHRQVAKYQSEHIEQGGDGITLVVLK
jgi:DNA mismatch repair protein MutS2